MRPNPMISTVDCCGGRYWFLATLVIAGVLTARCGSGPLPHTPEDPPQTDSQSKPAEPPTAVPHAAPWTGPDPMLNEVVICKAAGLFVDGKLQISADADYSGMTQCKASWVHFKPGGYEACCDSMCCEWADPDYSPESQLSGEGQPCEGTADCQTGLRCFGDEGDLWCRYGEVGMPCGLKQWCAEGLLCADSNVCTELLTEEGDKCDSLAVCLWPLHCHCPDAGICTCHDGSVGDPCTSATCAFGLYCHAAAEWTGDPLCYDGLKGDPCASDWQCNHGLSCGGTFMNAKACALLLDEGAICGNSDLELCGEGLTCKTVDGSERCAPLGGDAESCSSDSDCLPLHNCSGVPASCWDGMEGDPCVSDGDCTSPYTCNSDPSGKNRCYWKLSYGETCGWASTPWVACDDGLVCSQAATPARCRYESQQFGPCGADEDCVQPLMCALEAGMCLLGTDGSPCLDQAWCKPGWECSQLHSSCFNGDHADPCDDLGCAPGFVCYPQIAQCLDGGPGSPCTASSDCLDSVCVELWGESVCVAFLSPGQPCGSSAEPYTACDSSSVCVDPPGFCSQGLEGDACFEDAHCAADLGCNQEESKCYDGSLHDPCSQSFPCANGLQCHPETGKCANATEGSSCEGDTDCIPELMCVPSIQKCHSAANGSPCFEPADCGAAHDCHLGLNVCYNGYQGSPCPDDNWCLGGLVCGPEGTCAGAEEVD